MMKKAKNEEGSNKKKRTVEQLIIQNYREIYFNELTRGGISNFLSSGFS